MSTIKKIMSLFLLLTCLLQVFSPVYAVDSKKFERIHSRIESFSERRFFKKFNRQFDKFRTEIEDLIIFESDSSLDFFLNDLLISVEQQGYYVLANILRQQLANGSDSLRSILNQMTSEESRLRAQEALRVQINEAGGFKAFYENQKIHKKNNLDLKCRIKKIGLIALIAPLTIAGVNSGVAVATYLSAGIFNSYVLFLSAGTGIATFGTFGWINNRLSTGCYYETENDRYNAFL